MLYLCEDVGATSCSNTLFLHLDVGLYASVYPDSTPTSSHRPNLKQLLAPQRANGTRRACLHGLKSYIVWNFTRASSFSEGQLLDGHEHHINLSNE
jgi:hypothetical protein